MHKSCSVHYDGIYEKSSYISKTTLQLLKAFPDLATVNLSFDGSKWNLYRVSAQVSNRIQAQSSFIFWFSWLSWVYSKAWTSLDLIANMSLNSIEILLRFITTGVVWKWWHFCWICIFSTWQRMDLNGDGVVSQEEFLETCLGDENITNAIVEVSNVMI